VLTDRGKGYFDWLALFSGKSNMPSSLTQLFTNTCFQTVKASARNLKPTAIYFHILDGIEPTSKWWKFAKLLKGPSGPLIKIRPFNSSSFSIGKVRKGMPEMKPAHVSDFKRLVHHVNVLFYPTLS
jgi:hypothetical protein